MFQNIVRAHIVTELLCDAVETNDHGGSTSSGFCKFRFHFTSGTEAINKISSFLKATKV